MSFQEAKKPKNSFLKPLNLKHLNITSRQAKSHVTFEKTNVRRTAKESLWSTQGGRGLAKKMFSAAERQPSMPTQQAGILCMKLRKSGAGPFHYGCLSQAEIGSKTDVFIRELQSQLCGEIQVSGQIQPKFFPRPASLRETLLPPPIRDPLIRPAPFCEFPVHLRP